MKRRKTGGKSAKSRGRRNAKRRSRARQRGSPKTNEATAARFRRERDEALEQQAAVAEVLRVISSAGEADIFPQDVTRALLNVISNGFYAATKRKAEAGDDDCEPMLAASTKSLGGRVEIRIRDNGTGIPPDVKEKMFDPFFTTKPAGEGTGLGLSISHDIIVKQHGGSIEVDTRPGEFTEISVTLPRAVIAVPEAGKRV